MTRPDSLVVLMGARSALGRSDRVTRHSSRALRPMAEIGQVGDYPGPGVRY